MKLSRGAYFCLILLFGLWTRPVIAQDGAYPEYTDLYVNDFAGILSPETTTEIRTMFAQLKQDAGIEAVIVTIPSIANYKTGDTTIESFATNLFNHWGVGDAEKDNGVMLLVALADRKVRIEVGTQYENTLNAPMQDIINENILPDFRDGDYNRGVYDGARGIVRVVTGTEPPSILPSPPVPSNISVDSSSPRIPEDALPFAAGGGLLVLGGGFTAYRRYMRYRPRRCSKCDQMMRRLDEHEDDPFLDEGQQHEESLGSVDYDVWKCDHCGTHEKLPYNAIFTRFGHCKSCNYRTLRTTSQVLVSATYESSGTKEITEHCQHCNHHNSYIRVIPRLTRSSSSSSSGGSSGGSFGGGSSSGGGASGSW